MAVGLAMLYLVEHCSKHALGVENDIHNDCLKSRI